MVEERKVSFWKNGDRIKEKIGGKKNGVFFLFQKEGDWEHARGEEQRRKKNKERSEGRRRKQERTSVVLGFLRGYLSAYVFLR